MTGTDDLLADLDHATGVHVMWPQSAGLARRAAEALRRERAEVERIRANLHHHLSPKTDPCQDRGVDWPCDVADALLWPEDADRTRAEVDAILAAAASPRPAEAGDRYWPDRTVRLPDAIEEWLDGHFAGDKDDEADELTAYRNVAAVALWSLIYRQGDPGSDQAALDAIAAAASPRPAEAGDR